MPASRSTADQDYRHLLREFYRLDPDDYLLRL
jgi:hypothetical protein